MGNNLESRLTLIITTKDRYDDLSYTLKQLKTLGLNELPIIIIDDASKDIVVDPDLISDFPNSTVLRNESSVGLIVNRNRLAILARTDYICSLDDDSCFVSSDGIGDAISYLDANQDVIGLELNNYDVNFGEKPRGYALPHSVQTYTGCGHILRRQLFLEIGGYKEYFVHMCEERDFCMRAYRLGYKVVSFRSVIVEHQRSPVARNVNRNQMYLVRNTILFSFLNLPMAQFLIRLIFVVPYFSMNLKMGRGIIPTLKGWFFAIGQIFRISDQRAAMSTKAFKEFRKFPLR